MCEKEDDRSDWEREQDEAEDWSMENDPYSDDEKENIGDNFEGNDWKGD